jgi:hypothetical protein
MGITVEWIDGERTLLLWKVREPWTWEELDVAFRELIYYIKSVSYDVDVLVDARRIESVPKNILSMIDTRYSIYPANMKSVLLIGAPSMIEAVIAVMRQLHPATFSRFRFVKNFDEAYRLVDASYH